MKIIQLPRGGGKTTEMILWLIEGHAKGIHRILIVADRARQTHINRIIFKLWDENGTPDYLNNAANSVFSVGDIQTLANGAQLMLGKPDIEVGIDDADIILQMAMKMHRPISIISVTGGTLGTDEPKTIPSDEAKSETIQAS